LKREKGRVSGRYGIIQKTKGRGKGTSESIVTHMRPKKKINTPGEKW